MFNKSFTSVLIVTSAFTLAFGQTSDAPKEKTAQVFSFSFDGDGSYLGVQTEEVNNANFAKLGLREVRGVAVERVIENSPAASAGIQAGDVIVRFNGEEVTSTRKLTRLISEIAPDHQAKVKVVRGGSEHEITVTLAKRPAPKFENGNFRFGVPGPLGKLEMPNMPPMPDMKDFPRGEIPRVFMTPDGDNKSFSWRAGEGRQIGIGVYPLTKQLGENYGVESGLMINMVRKDSPAAKAGLKAGDIIVEVDGKAVSGDFDLIRAINGKKEGDIQLTIIRDRNRQTITVTPEASKDGGFFFQTDDDGGFMPITPPEPGQIRLSPMPGRIGVPTPMVRMEPMSIPSPLPIWSPRCIL